MNAKRFFKKFPQETRNTNCLRDVGCPDCGNRESFSIRAISMFLFGDGGTSEFEGDVNIDDDAFAVCHRCNRKGDLREFTFDGLDKLYEARDRMIGGYQ